jgi:S-sulfo-L-cysteine synthase (O-acetyl-L-serine-dependent)
MNTPTAAMPQTLAPTWKARLHRTGALIGRTPLHHFASLSPSPGVRVLGKLEWQQLGGSVKARAAYRIIGQALNQRFPPSGVRLLDASSGNTGIAYGAIAASLGIPVTLCLPENASSERKRVLKGLGVEIIGTDPQAGTDGAQEVAAALAREEPGRFIYLDQYKNPENWKAHYYGTAAEIYRQTSGRISHFVCGLGTTGSFVGNSRALKRWVPDVTCIALQPDGPMHGLEGWKHLETALVPGIYDPSLAQVIETVSTEEAYDMIRFIARHEGLLLSPSSAANLAGARRVAARLNQGTVVTLLPDNADKYGEVLTSLYP